MAWYKIGNTIYTEEELRAYNSGLMDLVVPSTVTAIGVRLLYQWIDHLSFFMVHTTISKLIYVIAGLFLFSFGYTYRKLILALAVFTVIGGFFLLGSMAFLGWLTS